MVQATANENAAKIFFDLIYNIHNLHTVNIID
jgi:hypothetical protein